MADFTQTISEDLRVFGLGPVSRWNEFEWTSSPADINVTTNCLWGSNRTIFTIERVQTLTITFDAASYRFDVEKFIEDDFTTFSVVQAFDVEKLVAGSLPLESDSTEMIRTYNSDIYNYIFAGETTDGNDQVVSEFTPITKPVSSFTTYTTSTVTWTEV